MGEFMSDFQTNTTHSESYGALQDIVDSLFVNKGPLDEVRRLDVIVAGESGDLPADLQEVIALLPPGNYSRQRLCDQLNSSIGGHAWGQVYGTVE